MYLVCHRWWSADPRQNTSITPSACATAAGRLPSRPMCSGRSADQPWPGRLTAAQSPPSVPWANTATVPGTEVTADGRVASEPPMPAACCQPAPGDASWPR